MHNIVASGRGVIAILDDVTEHFEKIARVSSLLSRRHVYGATAPSLSLAACLILSLKKGFRASPLKNGVTYFYDPSE